MTTWAHRTIIVPAALVAQARELGAALDPSGAGMYTTPLSSTGKAPATHYSSAGHIDENFAAILGDASLLYTYAQAGAQAQGMTLKATQANTTALVQQSIVDERLSSEVLAEQGLKIISSGTA